MDGAPGIGARGGGMTFSASHLMIALGIVIAQALILAAMGSPAICKCGHIALWYANPAGPETSQQITDWYTPSHVIHGVLFYWLLWLVAPRVPMGLRLAAAVGIEVGWEILENTPLIIERYRQSALAQGYSGDSILNSVSDTLAAVLGFLIAWRLPVIVTVGLVIAAEAFTGYMIRDNLLLNIVQLLAPNETLSRWQMGK